MKCFWCLSRISCILVILSYSECMFTSDEIISFRERVREMFQFGYEGYLKHAYPYDELQPLTCDGVDTWGSYSLTLIDALDTLAVMGNYTEFNRVARLLVETLDFDEDINVSVFETNIRVVGGLISAHLMSRDTGFQVHANWPCEGPLLNLAEQAAEKIIAAFDTKTRMPYGTVNLMYGVPKGETPITCTAGVGTSVSYTHLDTLSRLTGNPMFEDVALEALDALWERKSEIGLVGNHINVESGKWTALDAGIGAGIDSYFEYLLKGGLLLGNSHLLEMFYEYETMIEKYIKKDDWYMWVQMSKGVVTVPVFQSLEAFWPGLQSMMGKIDDGMKSLHNYYQVWQQLGFLPEFYNIVHGKVVDKRDGYPLRPELAESIMYLYQATKDPFLLQMGRDMIESIEKVAKTRCGYTSIKDVRNHQLDNRMESFFLSETTKYLYLLFDPDNKIHGTGGKGEVINTDSGSCVVNSGSYIFNTEAHPVDIGALDCCKKQPAQEEIEFAFNVLRNNKKRLQFLNNYVNSDQHTRRDLTSTFNCSARPFYSRLSILGEMFEEEIIKQAKLPENVCQDSIAKP
ncbi:ER degradation-enhancing alpha-mannosidase-like protein 2 [Anneissia japonica]|uniref:ER degradation-enhancing alpha-mannosidase-like protein 2 n=1 Tax=Anneissia japonica TaxID=1529436 RepID=UPI001425976B|nr:ER degradation-enhancing alpha-mannosidase-like protein 2 [Anneissia japonica]